MNEPNERVDLINDLMEDYAYADQFEEDCEVIFPALDEAIRNRQLETKREEFEKLSDAELRRLHAELTLASCPGNGTR